MEKVYDKVAPTPHVAKKNGNLPNELNFQKLKGNDLLYSQFVEKNMKRPKKCPMNSKRPRYCMAIGLRSQ